MAFDSFNFDVDFGVMQKDLDRVNRKPNQNAVELSEKYAQLPKGVGSLTVRILPPDSRRGYSRPYASTRLHYHEQRAYHCLVSLEDGRWKNHGQCPLCNYYNYLFSEVRKAKTEDDAKTLRAFAVRFKPIERFYYNVIVRKEIDPESGEARMNVGPKIFSSGKSLHEKILIGFLGSKKFDEKPLGNIAHPITGRDFKINKEIKRSDEGDFPNYSSSRFEDESRLGTDEQISAWLESMWDLEAERNDNIKTYDELQHLIDIVQGKAEDESLGFDTSQFSIPAEFNADSSDEPVETKPAISAAKAEPKKESKPKKAKKEEAPFNTDDQAVLEGDWVEDLQAELEKSMP